MNLFKKKKKTPVSHQCVFLSNQFFHSIHCFAFINMLSDHSHFSFVCNRPEIVIKCRNHSIARARFCCSRTHFLVKRKVVAIKKDVWG